ncbi:MAG: acetyl-CoA carboxylase, biotin carboxyl carrier protein [Chlamydiae bacterium RIFCSPHIGHO2_12_FULL_27_8]|nr:MAG: acetyl-CoA carboxylase, biotin carboxyl carrier protein [Chlamydiae bacterium RIFCSPHIGHO2_12_FULL_27_8]OGN66626.1 MAG: acetyl-CoA carboxylase, biotin carboxyl carrier protein [Chlamydiae bacterium RIFCSPLOWO2_01_FULL_28_7]
MDLKDIKKIISLLEEHQLKKIHYKEGEFEIEIERGFDEREPTKIKVEEKIEILPKKQENFITSPMVGTFYHSSSPDKSAFVKIGDLVFEDTIVCIIEAMKVLNEVRANKKGVIKEILVKNTDPVEFGTKLFKIE